MLTKLTLIGLVTAVELNCAASLAAEKQNQFRNYTFKQEYSYDFKQSSIIGCIAGATKVLVQYGLDLDLNSDTSKDNRQAYVWGYSKDGRSGGTIECNADENETILMYSNYTDDGKGAWELFQKISQTSW